MLKVLADEVGVLRHANMVLLDCVLVQAVRNHFL